MKKLISYTLLASVITAGLPWYALASQGSNAPKARVADWGQGVKVRLSADCDPTVEQSPGKVSASNVKGRIHVKLNGHSKLVLKTTSGMIVANSGEFLVDSEGKTKLHVFKGDAHVEGLASDVELPVEANAWITGGKEVALRGSDVRRRQGDPDEFSRRRDRVKGAGKEKTPKVKSLPINNTTTPPLNTTTPPVNTTVNPPVNNNPPPPNNTPPPPNNPPVVVGGGFNPLWLLIPAGGIAGIIIANNGDTNNAVVAPASP